MPVRPFANWRSRRVAALDAHRENHSPIMSRNVILDLEPRLAGHHRLHAVRAHLLEMCGDRDGALAEYRAAARKTASVPEQRYLLTRAARLTV